MSNTTNNDGFITPLGRFFSPVLPLVFDDSLTYYEQQSKIVDKLNQVIDFTKINSIKYADPLQWDITSQYEANTVVVDTNGNAYLSVQAVPAGISINRTDYWTKIGNFDALWANVKAAITPFDEGADNVATRAYKVNDLVWVQGNLYVVTKAMVAGDKFLSGNSKISSMNVELAALRATINSLQENLQQQINDTNELLGIVQNELVFEKETRKKADDNLNDKIDSETTARTNADTILGGRIDNEVAARAAAITAEAKAREDADDELRAEISGANYYIVPETYGAKGDGMTDDTTALQAAFNAAGVGKAILLRGQYVISATINVKRDTTVEGINNRVRGVLRPYIIVKGDITAFNIVGAQDESVDYGGTCENVTFKWVTVAKAATATSDCTAFNVQWARFVNFYGCSVSDFPKAISFANVNGLTVDTFEYSGSGNLSKNVIYKFNNGGSTGITIKNLVANNFTESSDNYVYNDTTGNGQAGDRYIENVLAVSNWSNVIYYTHGTGFSCHVHIKDIFADALKANLVYLVGTGANENAVVSNVGCVGGSGSYRGFLSSHYNNVILDGVYGSGQSTYDFVALDNTLDCIVNNVVLAAPSTYIVSLIKTARATISNVTANQVGSNNADSDCSYCMWSNIRAVTSNNLLLTSQENMGVNISPASTN